MRKEDEHSGSLNRCEACGTAVPTYDVVNYGSIDGGYRMWGNTWPGGVPDHFKVV